MVASHAAVRRHIVPIGVVALVVSVMLVVPPLVLGEATGRTYAIAAAVSILAVGGAAPYALFVGVFTLPLVYFGYASYAAPHRTASTAHSFTALTAIRHVCGGVVYALCAAVVGAIGFGSQIGSPATRGVGAVAGQPAFLLGGGLAVAGTFVALQLWRYATSHAALDVKRVLATAFLGVCLVFAPIIARLQFAQL